MGKFMVEAEFSRLLRRFIKERRLTQRVLTEKLKSQGYLRTESTVSKWVRGKRIPPADVVEVLEDILELPKGWLLKSAGYTADAQVRSSSVVNSEQARHFQELSIALLSLASNLESCQEQIDENSGPEIGEVLHGGWLNMIDGVADALSVRMREVDKRLALNLLQHLKQEFPELNDISDWAQLTEDKITDDFIARLKLKANRGDFTGTCDLCPLDDELLSE
jgi:transcriptional regulator with XRE-family HTH domain